MARTKVIIERTHTTDFLRVSVDLVRVRFDDQNRAERLLDDGVDHNLTWHAKGAIGSTYSVKVTRLDGTVLCSGASPAGGLADPIDFGYCGPFRTP